MLGNHVPELTQDVCVVTAWVLSSRRSLFSFHQIFSMSNFCNHMIPLSFWGPQVSHFCQYCNPWLCHKYGIKLNFTYRMSVDACSQFHWNTLLCVVWLVDGCMMCVVFYHGCVVSGYNTVCRHCHVVLTCSCHKITMTTSSSSSSRLCEHSSVSLCKSQNCELQVLNAM